MSEIKLLQGDCLELMKQIFEKSIDLVITDLPYGTTRCSWDSVLPFESVWGGLNRIVKENTAILLFGQEPFSTLLRMSNLKNYKYDLIWKKEQGTNFALSHKMPLRITENISVFYQKLPKYHFEGEKLEKPSFHALPVVKSDSNFISNKNIDEDGNRIYKFYEYKTKTNFLEFSRDAECFHPTQKPIKLLKYLIETYSDEGDTVLDITMGSGSTGVACKLTNRNFIGMELDKNYFEIAKQRIENGFVQENITDDELNSLPLFL